MKWAAVGGGGGKKDWKTVKPEARPKLGCSQIATDSQPKLRCSQIATEGRAYLLSATLPAPFLIHQSHRVPWTLGSLHDC